MCRGENQARVLDGGTDSGGDMGSENQDDLLELVSVCAGDPGEKTRTICWRPGPWMEENSTGRLPESGSIQAEDPGRRKPDDLMGNGHVY